MPRIADPVRGAGKGLTLVAGTFFPAGSGAPTVAESSGAGGNIGWTVARTSAGVFTVTFAEKYPVCIAKFAQLQRTTAAGLKCELGDYSASAGTLVIRTLAEPFAADRLFVSAETTATGAAQNVAHGLGVAPTKVFVALTEHPGTPDTGAFDVAEGSHDATNVVLTVTINTKFKVLAYSTTPNVADIAANANNSISFACVFSTHASPK